MAHLKCVSASENCPHFNFSRPKAVLHLLSSGSRARASSQYGSGYRVACLYCSKCRPVMYSSSLEAISFGGGGSVAGAGREVPMFRTFGGVYWMISCPSLVSSWTRESLPPGTSNVRPARRQAANFFQDG